MNTLQILNKYKLNRDSDIKQFSKELYNMNKKTINDIIIKNKNMNIIFTGLAFEGMEAAITNANYKFMIKTDIDTLFTQYNLRTLEYISKYKKELTSLLKSNQDIRKKLKIILYKYKIRRGLFCHNVNDMMSFINDAKIMAKKENYKYLTKDKIIKEINKLLQFH